MAKRDGSVEEEREEKQATRKMRSRKGRGVVKGLRKGSKRVKRSWSKGRAGGMNRCVEKETPIQILW